MFLNNNEKIPIFYSRDAISIPAHDTQHKIHTYNDNYSKLLYIDVQTENKIHLSENLSGISKIELMGYVKRTLPSTASFNIVAVPWNNSVLEPLYVTESGRSGDICVPVKTSLNKPLMIASFPKMEGRIDRGKLRFSTNIDGILILKITFARYINN